MTPPTRDDAAFEVEALCWLADVQRYARSLTRDESDADDLVQDTFLTAHRQWHQFDAGTECRAWLFTICRHRFYRTRERAARQLPVEDAELESLAAAALHESARRDGLSDAFERSEVRAAVRDAIAALPPAFREVAVLVDIIGHTYESAATILDAPVGTVRSRLFRARRLLQERLLAHARDAGLEARRPTNGSPETAR